MTIERKKKKMIRNINWKLRLQNKVTLTSIVLQIISLVYMILAAAGITPSINESVIVAIAETIIGILALVGIVTDPTTAGISDSTQALNYVAPKED